MKDELVSQGVILVIGIIGLYFFLAISAGLGG